jgi:hypothetical protein
MATTKSIPYVPLGERGPASVRVILARASGPGSKPSKGTLSARRPRGCPDNNREMLAADRWYY